MTICTGISKFSGMSIEGVTGLAIGFFCAFKDRTTEFRNSFNLMMTTFTGTQLMIIISHTPIRCIGVAGDTISRKMRRFHRIHFFFCQTHHENLI